MLAFFLLYVSVNPSPPGLQVGALIIQSAVPTLYKAAEAVIETDLGLKICTIHLFTLVHVQLMLRRDGFSMLITLLTELGWSFV